MNNNITFKEEFNNFHIDKEEEKVLKIEAMNKIRDSIIKDFNSYDFESALTEYKEYFNPWNAPREDYEILEPLSHLRLYKQSDKLPSYCLEILPNVIAGSDYSETKRLSPFIVEFFVRMAIGDILYMRIENPADNAIRYSYFINSNEPKLQPLINTVRKSYFKINSKTSLKITDEIYENFNLITKFIDAIGLGNEILDAVNIDKQTLQVDSSQLGYRKLESNDKKVRLDAEKPDDYDDRLELVKNTYGERNLDLIAFSTFVLLGPIDKELIVAINDEGGSGKTTFLNALKAFDKNFTTDFTDIDLLKSKNGFDKGSAMANLEGKKTLLIDEASSLDRTVGNLLKVIASGATQQIRKGNSLTYTAWIKCKVLICTNEDYDFLGINAINRRVLRIRFTNDKSTDWWYGKTWTGKTRHDEIMDARTVSSLMVRGKSI